MQYTVIQSRKERNFNMSGKLYIVGTPIGNMGDMTYRGVEALEKVDFICAEDTRVSVKLLNYFNIKKPLVSYHEHSARSVSESIVNRIEAGEKTAPLSPMRECPASLIPARILLKCAPKEELRRR